jgi:hypothetical protein
LAVRAGLGVAGWREPETVKDPASEILRKPFVTVTLTLAFEAATPEGG